MSSTDRFIVAPERPRNCAKLSLWAAFDAIRRFPVLPETSLSARFRVRHCDVAKAHAPARRSVPRGSNFSSSRLTALTSQRQPDARTATVWFVVGPGCDHRPALVIGSSKSFPIRPIRNARAFRDFHLVPSGRYFFHFFQMTAPPAGSPPAMNITTPLFRLCCSRSPKP